MQDRGGNQERWIALALWSGLFAALLLSSIMIAGFAARTNSVLNPAWVSYFPASGPQSVDIRSQTPTIGSFVLLAQIVMAVFVAINVVRAWLRFGQLTLQLVIAYSKVDSDDSRRTIIAQFLTLKRPTDSIPGSYLTDCLRFLAYAWGVIIIWPAVLAFVWVII